jgi:outer membrane protein OmpA-like peptidoglycan-associated protein
VSKTARTAVIFMLFAAAAAPAGLAQVSGAPKPIPVPPIPAPPQLGTPPKISLPAIVPPQAHPVGHIPDAPDIERLPIPPEAAITPADKTDPVPPPPRGTETPAPPMVSPGAAIANIQETFFIVDPGSAQFSASAENKLKDIAQDMIRNPAARLEVRTFSPAKVHNEGVARRLSLSRFLAIREFLTRAGVGDDRIDGRPLASQPNELNADRVELYIEQ